MSARDAAQRSREASRPRNPEDFKFETTPNFKVPAGLEFQLKPDDPMVAQYRNWAIESGLDQSQFSKGLDLIAGIRVGEAQQFATAKTEELGKLGATASDRINSITQWLAAMAGDKAKSMIAVFEQAPTASTVEAFETIMQKFTSQGAGGFNTNGRSVDNPNDGKIAGYEGMTFEQRRYAQDQQRQRQNGQAR